MRSTVSALALAALLLAGAPALGKKDNAKPDADSFVADAEKQLAADSVLSARAQWINETYITDDTDAIAAEFSARSTELGVRLAKQAARFDGDKSLSPDTRRKLDLLKLGLVLPAPDTPGAADELSKITTRLQSTYGKGRGTLKGKEIGGSDIEAAMGSDRNPAELK